MGFSNTVFNYITNSNITSQLYNTFFMLNIQYTNNYLQ